MKNLYTEGIKITEKLFGTIENASVEFVEKYFDLELFKSNLQFMGEYDENMTVDEFAEYFIGKYGIDFDDKLDNLDFEQIAKDYL